MTKVRPSEQMRNLGVVQLQHGAPILAEPARPFDLPAERDAAEQAVDALFASMERIAQVPLSPKAWGSPPRRSASAARLPSSSLPRKRYPGQPPKRLPRAVDWLSIAVRS